MRRLASLLSKVLEPRSWCAACKRPFFSDVRRTCPCGATARVFGFGLADGIKANDKF